MPAPPNDTPLTPEQSDLAAQYFPYARKIARSFLRSYGHRIGHEIESGAMLGLTCAARSFDPSLGYHFKTIAFTRIKGGCLSALRNHNRLRGQCETCAPLVLSEIIEEESVPHQNNICIDELLRLVTPDQRNILRLWSYGVTLREIAGRVGRSFCFVQKDFHRAIDTIREHTRTQHERN